MNPRGLISGLVLVVAGCAGIPNEEAFKYEVRKWERRDVNELVSAWGPPASTFRALNGTTVYTYNKGEPLPDTCVVNFTVDAAQKVTGWRYSGTTCRATY